MINYIRSKWVLPISSPPIEDGIIGICNGRIQVVGSSIDLRAAIDGPIDDLGDTVVLPGFVNAHCHLELGIGHSFFRGLQPVAATSFTEWIRTILTFKSTLTKNDEQEGISKAAAALSKSGVTTIADHISIHGPFESVLKTPFRGRLFLELIGAALETAQDSAQAAKKELAKLTLPLHWQCHITPHSAHALHPAILKTTIHSGDFFSIHLSESIDEAQCFKTQSGPLYNFLCTRSETPTWNGTTPIEHLTSTAPLSHPLLLVHGNTVTDADLNLLNPTLHRFVHCPGSHAYFNHPRFPLERIEARGFLVALGTDSWASNIHQDFLEEMRHFYRCYPQKTPADVIRHATLIGATALGLSHEIGSIELGKHADLIGFPSLGPDPHNAILSAREISWRHHQDWSRV